MSMSTAINILDDTLNFIKTYNFDENDSKQNSTLKWPSSKIRQTFIDYFVQQHNHTFKPSSGVVPYDDPTLLFTNAGMNQFKPIFLGNITDDDPLSKLTRACNSQKCIRAGGKQNDLDDVGKDTYHHTFFEMLGNWSFGDYYKQEAISMAWDLLINSYGLNKNRIYATYFGGDEKQNLPPDNDAKQIWLKYLPSQRVLPFDMKDNFWEMGDTGPCGPCTEIHYDRIGNRDAAYLVNMDDATVIEIWNLVFIQFNRNEDQTLTLLPNKHVDTGMGFERLASILQNKQSNYDTDIFVPIIKEIQKKTNCKRSYTGKVGKDDINGYDMAYRVVADHIRTLTIAITDGALPGMKKRNYVIRRICRRGVRYGTKLGGTIGFFKDLVDIVVTQLSDIFPEIKARKEKVKSVIEEEEILFNKTLKYGERRFKRLVEKLKAKNINQMPGYHALQLWKQTGFPKDLVILMLEEQNMTLNEKEYDKLLKEWLERDAALNKKNETSGFAKMSDTEKVYLKKNGVKVTDDSFKYEWKDIECKVMGIFDSNSRKFINLVTSDHKGLVGIILDRTSYYAESGGQVGDIGYIIDADDNKESELINAFKVDNSIEFGGYIIHIGEMTNGEINCLSIYKCKVDYDNRKKIAPNHTMTHVLNLALRNELGEECNQKGSLVDSDKLRFDYSTSKQLNINNIQNISIYCNKIIEKGVNVYCDVIEYKKAMTINSLRAMFGERYPINVRVVSIGIEPKILLNSPKDKKWFDYSVELCGGTHLNNTKEAENFIFLSDIPLSAGIRRIICVTGKGAKRAIQDANELCDDFKYANELDEGPILTKQLRFLSGKLESSKIDAVIKMKLRKDFEVLNEKDKQWNFKLKKLRKQKVIDMIGKINVKKDKKYIIKRVDVGLDKKALKEGVKKFYKNKENICVPIMLISCHPNGVKNKIMIYGKVPSEELNKGIHCGKWVESVLPYIDGPKQWKGVKNDVETEVQGKSMQNVHMVIKVAEEYMENNYQIKKS
eukprot:232132_1